ncbi:MAG: amino acid adenylation domain-containing protein [Desmonostoc vinosum HA7617-LM4]|jgi:amino acid adenylation domain-containing protein/thioester reductase-like protein|nr:amino acid adenylation domain-containing protein [Desmonostoc vinosum HA7617-LM4]
MLIHDSYYDVETTENPDINDELSKVALIHKLIELQVEKTPNAIAVEFAQEQLTYQQLNQRANQLAHHLINLGVKADTIVGICLERSLDLIIAIVGILKATGAYLPIDPSYPASRRRLMLENAQAEILLTHSHLEENSTTGLTQCIYLDQQNLTTPKTNPDIPQTGDNLAYIIYTSGSTGQPKGVAMAHRPLCNLLSWQLQTSTFPTAKTLQFTPISFDVSFQEIFATLIGGGVLVLITQQLRTDPSRLLEFLKDAQIQRLFLPFVALRQLAEVAQIDGIIPQHLREVITAGEQLRITPAIARFFEQLPNTKLHNHYGPSETHVVTAYTLTSDVENWPVLPPIGKPIANSQIYLLDAQLQAVPVGVVGQLYVGGVSLARGYLHRADLTTERFIISPWDSKQRLYQTGDLARYLPDGNLEYLGRADQQVKIRGYRIEPGEIEAVLERHACVRQAVVIVREEVQGDLRLVAYVLGDSALTTEQLRLFLHTQLPEFMVPSALVLLGQFPLTPSGKVDRLALPAPDYRNQRENLTAPRTSTEAALAKIWVDVLGLDQVGIDDRFLEIGGHSLLATQVVSRIRDMFQVELPLRRLFELSTINELARYLEIAQQEPQELQISPIELRSPQTNLSFSYVQEQLWFLDQLVPNHPFYNVPEAFRLNGSVDITTLEQSFQEIINRHEVLRTSFTTIHGNPIPVIAPCLRFQMTVVDLHELPETEVWQVIVKEAQLPFDLSQSPLLRVTLYKLSEQEHILFLNLHHIICDEWSIGVLLEELAQLYKAYSLGENSPLAELNIQYADYAIWQRQWLQGEVNNQQLSYWQQQLSNLPPELQLPTDYPRPAVPSYRGDRQYLTLPKSLSEKLQDLGRNEGVTLFITLLSAFQTLLYRYTKQEDILVGSPIANRRHSKVEHLIGFFVNTLVLRTDLSNSPSFRELLARVKEVTLEAYAHQDLPFEQIVQAVQPDRDLNHNPLFQVLFNLQNAPLPAWDVPNLNLTRLSVNNQTAKFDLFLELAQTPTGITGYFEYSTDLFKADAIARMIGHFQTLLESIVTNPDEKIASLSLLTQTEQQQLVTWNNTQTNHPEIQCVHKLIELQVEKTPNAIAVEFAQEQLTYEQLNQRANQLAHHLINLGVKADTIVGICLERSLDLIIAIVGILKATGAYLPIDPSYPASRRRLMLENAQAEILLTHSHLEENSTTGLTQCIYLDQQNLTTPKTNPDIPQTGDNLAYIIYTSGSTGQPKGVAMAHRPLCNLLSWQLQTSTFPTAKTLQFTPISFDVSFQEIFATLIGGGVLVLITQQLRTDPSRLLEFLKDAQIQRLFLPFVALRQLAEVAQIDGIIPQHLREVITAGEQLRITPAIARFFEQLPNTKLHNHYGPSETHVVTAYTLTSDVENWPVLPPIGKPIANSQIYLLDAQLQAVPVGVVGQLYVGGVSLARGYLHRADLTTERFIISPWDSKQRLYQTGDLARYLPDGNLEYLGRADQQVKIRGYRIEPGEIEAVLERHACVRQAVVIVREEVPGDLRLVAYVLGDSALTTEQLRLFLHTQLPEFMVPSALVLLGQFPLTPSGKVDRLALPAPECSRPELAVALIPARTQEEIVLADLWLQVLKIAQVGIHDNFFHLGGYSLQGVELVSKIRETFQVDLTLRSFFEHPTIAGLAEIIVAQQSGNSTRFNSVLDLHAEAVLDPTIDPKTAFMPTLDQPANILLTGATGFLGAFLLHELLQQTQANIYCLVRAANSQEASQRLKSNLEQYSLWDQTQGHRIIAVVGDLAQPLLGISSENFQVLTATIDVIYHNGGLVNFVYPYSVLKAPNVLGTQEVLRLACQTKVKPVHFVSTVGVFSPTAYPETRVIAEQPADRPQGLYGYTQSKWVAEKLVAIAHERGLPTSIYRPTWIEGHSQTGVCNRSDFLRSLIAGCIQMGLAPDWNMPVDIIPVDYISKAIVHLSKQKNSLKRVFHLSNPQLMSWQELINWIRIFGYSIQQIPFKNWIKEVLNLVPNAPENALHSFVNFLSEPVSETQMSVPELYFTAHSLRFDCQNTLDGLTNTAINCPPVNDELLSTYFSYLIDNGFLKSQNK